LSQGRKIGLIAGAGALPHTVVAQAKAQGDDIVVAALQGFSNPEDFDARAQAYGFGEIGGLIKKFKQEQCTHISFAGQVSRPEFANIKPDLKGMRLLPKVIKAAARGDDALLKLMVSVFEKEGFEILAPQDICHSSLMPQGPLGTVAPDEEQWADISKAMHIAAIIGAEDIGQGAVVHNGLVLAVEAQEGTDKMLKRVADLPAAIRGGVLAKRLKPGQEARVDLPTIGVRTVELAAKAGLTGIALQANKAFVMDIEAVKQKADALGLFVVGLDDAD